MLHRVLFILILTLLTNVVMADDLTDEALQQWFESDAFEPEYVDKSSDAQLKFIAPIVGETVPSSATQISITAESLRTGWIAIEQCHDALDAVPDAEIVYRFRAMRDLQVTESTNIESVWVEGQSVQLKNLARLARVCIKAEAQALSQINDGMYRLRYGPFQRKFLDGYFPYHISLTVNYPETIVSVSQIEPSPELGYDHKSKPGKLMADVWFTGKLIFVYHFTKR